MSDCGDDDVHICDTCMDIFLTREELKQHEEEKHSGKEEQAAKRSRSKSPSNEAPKKKVKMGPASRVRKDSSSERSSSKRKESRSRSTSPVNGEVSRIIDRLASTESDAGSQKSEKSDRDRGDRDKHRKKHKHRDREREKDRHEDRHKKKHKDRDRSRERKNGSNGVTSKVKQVDIFGKMNLADDEEDANRRKAEKAKAEWQRKNDLIKGKDVKSIKPKSDLNDFIDDDDMPKKKYRDEPRIDDEFKKKIREEARFEDKPKKSSGLSTGFASQGTVKAHENDGGPECFKCGQVCKDNSNLKNHVLSHYYQVFYDVLPDSKPYPCPLCESTSRDRITLVRHYAFTHKKFFEMTDVKPEHLGSSRIGSKGVVKKLVKEEKPISRYDNDSDDDSSKKKLINMSVEDKIKSMKSKFFRVNDGSSNNHDGDDKHKDHKKHKKHKHKDHKEHKKEKKHKKEKHRDRDRDRDRDQSSSKDPLTSLMKDMSPVSDSSEKTTNKGQGEEGRPRSPPGSPRYKSPERDEHEGNVDAGGENNAEESDEDLLGDLDIAPVFA